jgi:glucosamine--fructose-6-phosphate aminotransferase (isomerizing)
VTQVTTLVILAAAIAKARGALGSRQEQELGAALRALPRRRPALETRSASAELARRYVNSRGFMFVGRGYTYPTALEGALKLKEVSYVHAEGYAAGELKHGPISLLDAECPLVAVATRSSVYDKLDQQRHGGPARDARVHRRRDRGRPADRALRRRHLLGARHARGAQPVLAIIPLQLFAYHVAIARGTDVDQPRNLAKSVTVE